MGLDLSSFANAVTRLAEGVGAMRAEPKDELIRDGVIQRFEFTYELAHKMLRRHLEFISASPAEVERMPFQDLIRTGNEQGLLRSDWRKWRDYRQARNDTSHTYNESKAECVAEQIPDFLEEVRHLLAVLQSIHPHAA